MWVTALQSGTGDCYSRLYEAVQKCHNGHSQRITRVLASICLDYGWSACPSGFFLQPVRLSIVGTAIKRVFPEESRSLMDLISLDRHKRLFKVLTAVRADSYLMITNLHLLLSQENQRHRVKDILPSIYVMSLHPRDAGYEAQKESYIHVKLCNQEPASTSTSMPITAFAVTFQLVCSC